MTIPSLEAPSRPVPYHLMDHRESSRARRRQTGSVLLAVLCLVAVLSFVIISTATVAKSHADQQSARQGMMRARQIAEMGLAVAAHPQMKAGDPLLRRDVSSIEGYHATISTEEGRININAMLIEERLPILERILAFMGLSPAEAQGLAAALMDCADPDDLKRRPDSAERLDYERMGLAGLPFNRPFRSLDEVELLPQTARLIAVRPDWRNDFTVRGEGRIDVNTANSDVLAAFTGSSPATARQLVAHRQGPDGRSQTTDDRMLTTAEALAMLGVAEGRFSEMEPLLTPQGRTRRVESIGTAAESRCGVAVVLAQADGGLRMAEWREFPVEATPRR